MSYSFKNLKYPSNILSGIADYVLLAPVGWFTSIKYPVAPFTSPGDEVLIKTAHTFSSGKGFVKYLLAPEKNQFDAKTIGDKGFQKFDQDLRIFIPGSYAELHEAMKNWLNTPLIALARDSSCAANIYYQLGSECVYAYLTVDFSTGTTKDGVKGYTGAINYASDAVYVYAAAVQLLADDAELPPGADSKVFLAPLTTTQLDGDLAAMQAAAAGALYTDVTDLYNALVAAADGSIMQLYFINDFGEIISDYLLADLSSEMAMIDSIEQWLADNGSGQTLQLVNNELVLIDPNAEVSLLGIAVPQNLLANGTDVFATGNLIFTA